MADTEYRILTLNIHSMGVDLSEDEVGEFASRFAKVLSVKMGFTKKTGKPRDFAIIKIIGRPSALITVVKHFKFRGKNITLTTIKSEPLTKDINI